MYRAHIREDREQSCKDHSIHTAEYSAASLKKTGLETTGYLSGLIHDTGKYSDQFNDYIERAARGEKVRRGSVIHSFAGVRLILENFHSVFGKNSIETGWENITSEIIGSAVGSHHGLFDEYDPCGQSGLEHRMKAQPDYDIAAVQSFYEECAEKKSIEYLFRKSSEEIAAIATKCNEMAMLADEKYAGQELMFYLGVLQRLVISAVIDGDRRDTAEFMSDNELTFSKYTEEELIDIWNEALEHMERMISGFPCKTDIQKARRELSELCAEFADIAPGIYRLDLPTGSGKTLSSLRYALRHAIKYKKERIIFAVPLLSILDQNSDVIRKAIGNDGIILEHHSDIILDELSKEECSRRELLMDTWDVPVIITTMVQFLNTLFDGRTSSIRRMNSLSNSIIILDEVQTVPTKMISLFNLSMNFLSEICGATIILCSATQPALDIAKHRILVSEREFIPSEERKRFRQMFKRNTTSFDGEKSIREIAVKAEQLAKANGSVLIVCNKKDEARQTFELLRNSGNHCFHLSTSMCMAHRKEVLRDVTQCLEEGRKVICVSTQLIEAGVDIPNLNIRKGPGTNYGRTGKFTGKGTFTITETRKGKGSDAGWGKLKSGAGWISLDYAKRI